MKTKLDEVFANYINKIDHPIIAVETGCSFNWGEEFHPYISTLNIVRSLIAPTNGILYSLDNDSEKIELCRYNMDKLGLGRYVSFMLGDSVDSLYRLPSNSVNFVWLDSSEDSDHVRTP